MEYIIAKLNEFLQIRWNVEKAQRLLIDRQSEIEPASKIRLILSLGI